MILENELSATLELDGEWEFKLGDGERHAIPVPSAWETHVADKLADGPAFYRRQFTVPESWLGSTVIALEADAISFDATLRVNGEVAGTHQGMWSPFQIDITPFVRTGENTIEFEVWKPGRRFPARESLSGFLPDVATTFGGIWQGIRIHVFSWAALSDVRVFAYGGGWLDVQGRIVGLGERRRYEIVVEVIDPHGNSVAQARADMADDLSFAAHLEIGHVHNWQTDTEATLYSVRLALRARDADIARVTRRVGFRDLETQNGAVLLNDSPKHVRGVLDWGWDAARICPTPSRIGVIENFEKARTLGFNLFKLCLFVPDETTFNVADEMGMLLWLEMPLWLPNVTPALRELALREYRDLFVRLHHHPSIAIVSLGCELNAQVDAEFLAALNALAREWFPNALHCDNSGSAEAYGGAQTGHSDFYDYHFYTDPHFFQPLVRHFQRSYRSNKPWIYGEFCDADTFRDFSQFDSEPWWLTEDTALDRDDFLATRDYKTRLQKAGVTDNGSALTAIARRQATEVRKFILEQVRATSAVGGYVVTGWLDTPITTSGIVDDHRGLKFRGEEWRRFNGDRILIMDRERRRHWIGGDRPLIKDPFVWWGGEAAEIHLAVSNGGPAVENARLHWRLAPFSGPEIAHGDRTVTIESADVDEVCLFKTRMPLASTLMELRLTATVSDEEQSQIIAQNSWKLWVVPRLPPLPEPDHAQLASALTDDVLTRARSGDSLVVWLQSPDSRFTRVVPFWREAIHVFEPHPIWDRVPQPGFADMRFYSVATDFAIDAEKLADRLGAQAEIKPVWRRYDARQMYWTDYIVEAKIGSGRVILTTLRFAGGLGAQPNSLDVNPMGAWLLDSLLK